MAIDYKAKYDLRQAMTSAIMAAIPDPAEWMMSCRWIAERLGLNPARALLIGGSVTLDIVCGGIVDEADKQSVTGGRVREVIAKIGARR